MGQIYMVFKDLQSHLTIIYRMDIKYGMYAQCKVVNIMFVSVYFHDEWLLTIFMYNITINKSSDKLNTPSQKIHHSP